VFAEIENMNDSEAHVYLPDPNSELENKVKQLTLGNVKTDTSDNDKYSNKNNYRDENAQLKITEHYKGILSNLGEDPTRQGLAKTPERAAKALMFFTKGYNDNMKGIYYGEKGGSSSSNFYKNNIKAMYKTKQHLKVNIFHI
jgi:GTP cyclohydrolase I